MTSSPKSWIAFGLINVLMLVTLAYAVWSPPGATKKLLLPGKTTHGHYQIEMDCAACHDAAKGGLQASCVKCHEAELKAAKDTHPASKFSDPTNADRLAVLDATQCVTCHREHVEDQTGEMGLTLPADYCYHCHQETLESRPSHQGFAFDSCATAGCHNYHDNRALYENFLLKHFDEPDVLDSPTVLVREPTTAASQRKSAADEDLVPSTKRSDGEWMHADAPVAKSTPELVSEWMTSAHAMAGVNCKGCHRATTTAWGVDRKDSKGLNAEPLPANWNDEVSVGVCANCHEQEAIGFGEGKHGMRLANGLSPMQPAMARLPMQHESRHRQLDCNACHPAHSYETSFAAVDACLQCHDDQHSRRYKDSRHFALWVMEVNGEAPEGTGVSCATCHMPRIKEADGRIRVQHNQNNNLRPNEKMVREVCMRCHGLQFTLDSLSDLSLVESCFGGMSERRVESIDMAKAWFDEKESQRAARRSRVQD